MLAKTKGISHITLICEDLERSAHLFRSLFGAVEVYASGEKRFSHAPEKFLFIDDLWIALMQGKAIERSYNHIAFRIEEEDLPSFEEKIRQLGLEVAPGRLRDAREGKSLYFYDYDNHLCELHTGDVEQRLEYYLQSEQQHV
jgi:fosfomycin resistance protein FosX